MHPLFMNAAFNKQSAKTIARLEKERNAKILSKKPKQNPVQTTYLQKKFLISKHCLEMKPQLIEIKTVA
jgi:hypothetical protein